MSYAILSEGQITAHGTSSELWPNTSFVGAPDEDFLASHGAVLIQTAKAHDAATEVLAAVEPYVEGGVVYSVSVQPKPAETPEPDWQGFYIAMISSAEFEAVYAAAAAEFPLKTAAVIAAFRHAENSQISRLAETWAVWKSVVTIPDEVKAGLVSLAEAKHLPPELIQAL
jgi:hypothetical protein